jgi:glutamine---fructose-6-phosphate transaminase (isomerizing)
VPQIEENEQYADKERNMNDTQFVREILAQPAALETVVDYYTAGQGRDLLRVAVRIIQASRKVIVTGMGTSLHTPYLLRKEFGDAVPFMEILDAGEFLHFGLDTVRKDDVVIAVSQSGESAETRQVVEKLKGKAQIISVVNNPESSMALNSDIVLPLRAGEESSISAKTYTNTLALLFLFSSAVKRENIDDTSRHLHEISRIMEENMEKVTGMAVHAADFYIPLSHLHFVARGNDMVSAAQGALILKEGAGVFSEALSGGLFRHGPIELAGEGHSIMFIVSRDNMPHLTLNLASETAALGSRTAVLSDHKKSGELPASGILSLVMECPVPRFFPILCAPFLELFVHQTAECKGREAGVFRHASKITARE